MNAQPNLSIVLAFQSLGFYTSPIYLLQSKKGYSTLSNEFIGLLICRRVKDTLFSKKISLFEGKYLLY